MFFCVVTACADDINEKHAAATSVSFIVTLCFISMFFIALSLRTFGSRRTSCSVQPSIVTRVDATLRRRVEGKKTESGALFATIF
jgi:hypothetical protein